MDRAGFTATGPVEEDVHFHLAAGNCIKGTHAASPSGVQVYWDHDTSNSYDRMTAVIADDGDETVTSDVTLSMKRGASSATEVIDDVDVGVVSFTAYGII